MRTSWLLASGTTAICMLALGACSGDKGETATTSGSSSRAATSSSGVTSGSGGADIGGGGGDAGPVVPTVSSWLGTNVNADLPRVDITYQLSPFDTPAAQKDANGYPVAGAAGTSQTDIGFVLPTGTYNISYKGGAALTVSGIGKLGGAWTTAGGEQRNTLQITGTPGAFGNFLTITVTATPGQTVQDLRILMPRASTTTRPRSSSRSSSACSPPSAPCASWSGRTSTAASSPTGPTGPRPRASGRRRTGSPTSTSWGS